MRLLIWYLRSFLRPWRHHTPVALILIAAIAVGIVLDLLLGSLAPPLWRAQKTVRVRDYKTAERLYWEILNQDLPEVPVVLDFLEIHAALSWTGLLTSDGQIKGPSQSGVSEEQIDAFLARPDLPPSIPLLGGYWRSLLRGEPEETIRDEIVGAADRDPPLPWANHVLAIEEDRKGQRLAAADRFEREGLRPGGPTEDLEQALYLYARAGAIDEVALRLRDPRFPASPQLRADVAFSQQRWGEWMSWLWPASYLRGDTASWFLAGLAAGLWLWFCWCLGGRGIGPGTQIAAFCLGALSIYPTHVIIDLERYLPGLVESGDLVRDAIFYVLGVGLREEAAKLLCFLPLLLLLRQRKDRGEALILGALVGLGFAAVENVSYLAGGDLATALTRFLTANFLHMSLTAIAAAAAADLARGKAESGAVFATTFGLAVLLHGIYDLFLASPALADMSFLGMTTFVVAARFFLRAAPVHRGRAADKPRGALGRLPLLRVLVLALVILASALFIYGSAMAGPKAAANALIGGLLGVGIIIAAFHHELGSR